MTSIVSDEKSVKAIFALYVLFFFKKTTFMTFLFTFSFFMCFTMVYMDVVSCLFSLFWPTENLRSVH